MSIGKGIPISTGFDLNSQSPLDNRTVFETVAERDSLPSINLYEGLECFIKNTKARYEYLNGQWKEIEIWDNVTVTKNETTNKLTLSFYSNNVLKREVEIDIPSVAVAEVEAWDDATVTKDVANNRNEISFYSKGVLKKTIYIDGLGGDTNVVYQVEQVEQGNTAPTDENILLWIDTSEEPLSSNLSDDLITEFRATIGSMQTTIDTLIDEINLLKARVLYLEQNQGAETISYTITTKDGDTIITKDGDTIITK